MHPENVDPKCHSRDALMDQLRQLNPSGPLVLRHAGDLLRRGPKAVRVCRRASGHGWGSDRGDNRGHRRLRSLSRGPGGRLTQDRVQARVRD